MPSDDPRALVLARRVSKRYRMAGATVDDRLEQTWTDTPLYLTG